MIRSVSSANTWISLLLFALLWLWASSGAEFSLNRIVIGIPRIADYLGRMFPPDLGMVPKMVGPLLETYQIAITSTFWAAVGGIPLAFLAARNTSPHPYIYIAARTLCSLLRGIPCMVLALLFVAMLGLGPLPAVAALIFHCTGTLGKYCSEQVELLDPTLPEAARVDGANELQIIWYIYLPTLLPAFSIYVTYYFEHNVRIGTVMGLVGAGGIGLGLTNAVRLFRYHETCTWLLLIMVNVLILDFGSRLIRKRLMQ